MNSYCYILYSETLKKFYVGSTSEPIQVRIEQHNSSFYGNKKYTHKAMDWHLFLSIDCSSRGQAESIEKHIKSMKSSKYIRSLGQYSEMRMKLLDKFRNK